MNIKYMYHAEGFLLFLHFKLGSLVHIADVQKHNCSKAQSQIDTDN